MALRTINTRVVVSAALGLIVGAALTTSTADAAEILVVANSGAPAVATEFNAQIPQHNFTAFDAGNNAPSLDMLNMYDGVLLFENGLFANSVNVGNAIGAWYEQGGGCVLIGTFYWQDRSNNPNYLDNFTWGLLETYDVMTGDSGACEYNSDTLDVNSIVPHPVTQGVTSLSANSYRGGTTLKMGATALALWSTPNQDNLPDPVVAVRDDMSQRFVGISIFPDYESYGNYGQDFDGDFHLLFGNALDWCILACGDGQVQQGEECDDGNTEDGDGCSSLCVQEFCGDGVANNNGEECDDGNDDDTDDCPTTCANAFCGDGFVHDGVEACDDGNDIDDDGCTNACTVPTCGDGILQPGEECDDANAEDTDDCLATCVLASCGDGFLWDGVEACDDGNDDDTDDCTTFCEPAACGDGFVQAGEECDDGNADNSDMCLDTCVVAVCGDGLVYAGFEECDDGNDVDDDECSNGCTIPGETDSDPTDGVTATDTDATTTTDSDGTTTDDTSGTSSGGETGTSDSGDGTTAGPTTSTTDDTSTAGESGETDSGGAAEEDGCGCAQTGDSRPAGLLALLLLVTLRRRRAA